MHGVRLRPDSTLIELKVRLFNRSEVHQTFLWWANVAARVHADYQSFFPSDVTVVADHAKRAISTFPVATGSYYGVDYPSRRDLDSRPDSPRRVPGDRLDWPRNIPVPTSYMCLGSQGDFFGGYDHRAGAGFVYYADHHYAVGKKQWTWGDAPFGHAWNRNLADDGAAYIELMAGVFTDFSHLAPGETKTFSQYWYPLAGTGPVVAANLDAALGVEHEEGRTVLRFDATRSLGVVELVVQDHDGDRLHSERLELGPDSRPTVAVDTTSPHSVEVRSDGRPLLSWQRPATAAGTTHDAGLAQPAREPAPPAEIGSVEELYLTGRHLEQYRHATRSPEPYWNEALSRDPGHAATHTALAARRYGEARFLEAEQHLRAAVARLTALNPNPDSGEAHYLLGLTLARLGRDDEAYAAFAKATWVDALAGPGNHQMAVIDARHGRDARALERAAEALRARPDQLQVRDLIVVLLRRAGHIAQAEQLLAETLALDPLDVWALHLAGRLDATRGHTEAQTLLDVAVEYARIGESQTALKLLEDTRVADAHRPLGQTACAVLADYHAGVVADRLGDAVHAAQVRARARSGDRTWNFLSRLDDVAALEAALTANPADATAAALLGHWCHAHNRVDDAIGHWRRSAALDPSDPVVWRNIAVATYNHRHDPRAATAAYEQAMRHAPGDVRLLSESDQLFKRIGVPVDVRLHRLELFPPALIERDDLAVAYAQLLVTAGRADEALEVLVNRRFQPWEGGEGQVLRAWERTRLSLGQQALARGDAATAVAHIEAALNPPESLGETRHPLANPAKLLLAMGIALDAAGDRDNAKQYWREATAAWGDFAEMSPSAFSENTYFSILAARRLGESEYADELVTGLTRHAEQLAQTPAVIDYFATSLPSLILFDEDPQRRLDLAVELLRAQLALLADDPIAARHHLHTVLAADPGHELARDLTNQLEAGGSRQ
jgi:tetratricopeptide (TPR) repeat protein